MDAKDTNLCCDLLTADQEDCRCAMKDWQLTSSKWVTLSSVIVGMAVLLPDACLSTCFCVVLMDFILQCLPVGLLTTGGSLKNIVTSLYTQRAVFWTSPADCLLICLTFSLYTGAPVQVQLHRWPSFWEVPVKSLVPPKEIPGQLTVPTSQLFFFAFSQALQLIVCMFVCRRCLAVVMRGQACRGHYL